MTICANGTPVRHDSMRQRMPCGEKLCSIARLIVFTSPAIVSAIALRIDGPSTGKIAVAISCGLRRTDSLIAFSTVGASAMRELPVARRRAATIACGSFSASSSGVISDVSRRRRSSSSWRRSPPNSSSRSSESS